MSNLPNSVIRLVPPTLRGGYCPDSWTEFARTLVGGTSAQVNLDRGHTFYNFGNTPVFPTPEPPIVPSPCGDCGTQDMLVDWTSSGGEDLNDLMTFRYIPDFVSYPNSPETTCVSYNQTTNSALIYFAAHDYVQELHFPNLVTANQIIIEDCPALTTVDLSALQSATGTTMRSYYFFYTDRGIRIDDCVNLTTITLGQNFVPTNGKTYEFTDVNIPDANIDEILCIFDSAAGFTSGTLDIFSLSGSPTAAGLACKASLQARGVTVFT